MLFRVPPQQKNVFTIPYLYPMSKKTVVIGASTNPERYSYKATERLKAHGHEVVPVGLKEGIGSPIELLYSWIDNSPKEGTSYYRIKQVNMDGKMVAQSEQMDMSTPQNPLFIDKGTRLVQVK